MRVIPQRQERNTAATVNAHVIAGYAHFTPAGFLKSAGPKGIDYLGMWTSYMFGASN